MRALVTGSAGFIGFHVAKRLVEDGHVVVGLDALTPFYDNGLKQRRHGILLGSDRFRPVIGRLEDVDTVRQAVDLAEPDVIIHLAAQAGVRYSLESPRTYIDSNIVGSWNLLEIAAAAKPGHLLLASTSSVYGAARTVPTIESARTDEPLSIYAASKKAMEALAHANAHLHGLPTTAFRFFTVYGPWGRPDMAVFKFVDAIAKSRPVDIYGDGSMKRDFTYVDDLVEALMRLIDVPPSPANRVERPGIEDTLSPVAPFRVVNIGRGEPVGLLDFVGGIERLLAKPAQRRFLPPQPGDVPETHADPALLEALTGFRPSTSLDEGLAAFIRWYRAEYQAAGESIVSEGAGVAN